MPQPNTTEAVLNIKRLVVSGNENDVSTFTVTINTPFIDLLKKFICMDEPTIGEFLNYGNVPCQFTRYRIRNGIIPELRDISQRTLLKFLANKPLIDSGTYAGKLPCSPEDVATGVDALLYTLTKFKSEWTYKATLRMSSRPSGAQ